jgi:hypothetical protein
MESTPNGVVFKNNRSWRSYMEERLPTRWVRTRPDESHWNTALDVQAGSFRPSLRHAPHESDRHWAVLGRRSKDCTFGGVHLPKFFRTSVVLNRLAHANRLTLGTRKSTKPTHSPYRNSSQGVQLVVRRRMLPVMLQTSVCGMP